MLNLDTRNARARDLRANHGAGMRLEGLALGLATTSLAVSILTLIYALGY